MKNTLSENFISQVLEQKQCFRSFGTSAFGPNVLAFMSNLLFVFSVSCGFAFKKFWFWCPSPPSKPFGFVSHISGISFQPLWISFPHHWDFLSTHNATSLVQLLTKFLLYGVFSCWLSGWTPTKPFSIYFLQIFLIYLRFSIYFPFVIKNGQKSQWWRRLRQKAVHQNNHRFNEFLPLHFLCLLSRLGENGWNGETLFSTALWLLYHLLTFRLWQVASWTLVFPASYAFKFYIIIPVKG